MCAPLLTLAIEAVPVVDSGRRDGATELGTVVQLYDQMARSDAERATALERNARTRLMSLNVELQDAKRGDDSERAKRLAASIDATRKEMESFAAEAAQATTDFTFAERRLRRAEREKVNVQKLTADAVRSFATERLRQIDEVVASWGSGRPARDTKLVEGLRAAFEALRRP